MITQYGKVIITEDKVLITEFTFDMSRENYTNIRTCQEIAIEWAMERLTETFKQNDELI